MTLWRERGRRHRNSPHQLRPLLFSRTDTTWLSMTDTRVSPFSLTADDPYLRWRDDKLAHCPSSLADLVVQVENPRQLSPDEKAAILDRCRRANMAVYKSRVDVDPVDPNKEMVRGLGEQLGLRRLDHNRGADEDAITSLKVQSDALHRGYIPYSNRPIAWHTDGYYNAPDRQIRGLILHCVRPAEVGGGMSCWTTRSPTS